jgi:hypothetical protein
MLEVGKVCSVKQIDYKNLLINARISKMLKQFIDVILNFNISIHTKLACIELNYSTIISTKNQYEYHY